MFNIASVCDKHLNVLLLSRNISVAAWEQRTFCKKNKFQHE